MTMLFRFPFPQSSSDVFILEHVVTLPSYWITGNNQMISFKGCKSNFKWSVRPCNARLTTVPLNLFIGSLMWRHLIKIFIHKEHLLFTIRKLTDATYDAWEIWYVKLKNHSPKTWCYYEWNAKLILGNSEFFGSLIICHIWHLLFFNWQGKLFICH